MVGSAPPPRIVYAALPTTRRSGGVHVMMQHVQLLRSVGHEALLWLPGPGDRPAWFDATVPTVVAPTLDLGADDLLVLPEVPLPPGLDPAPGARVVIFNQNHFFTYAAAGDRPDRPYPGWSTDPAVWTVSTESHAVLQALHPQLPVSLVPNFVSADRFVPAAAKRRRIVWFARKRPRESALLYQLLRGDARFAGVEPRPITDEDWTVVANLLGESAIFVSLAHTEGFGLPVAEALAAGCLVVGYDGGGGHELFAAPGAWSVAGQRPLLLVDQLYRVVQTMDGLAPLGAQNRDWVLSRYNPERTLAALRAAVRAALGRPGSAALASHPAQWLAMLPPQFHLTG